MSWNKPLYERPRPPTSAPTLQLAPGSCDDTALSSTREIDLDLLLTQVQSLTLKNRALLVRVQQLQTALLAILRSSDPQKDAEIQIIIAQTGPDQDILEMLRQVIEPVGIGLIPQVQPGTDSDMATAIATALGLDARVSLNDILAAIQALRSQPAQVASSPFITPVSPAAPVPITPAVHSTPTMASLPTVSAPTASPSVEVVSATPTAQDLELLDAIGQQGLVFSAELDVVMDGLSPQSTEAGWTDATRERYRRDALQHLVEVGLVERHVVDLQVPNNVWGAVGVGWAIQLTELGARRYTARAGQPPSDRPVRFKAHYKTIEAGALILIAKRLIASANTEDPRRWVAEVVDAVTASDEELARIGATCSYANGSARAFPDLLVKLTPAKGGVSHLAAVEVEIGKYKLPDLRAKLERNVLCYPPMPIYYIVPKEEIARDMASFKGGGKGKSEVQSAIDRVAATAGLPNGCQVIVYTLAQLASIGLRTPRELERFKLFESQERNGTATEEMKEALQEVRGSLPRICFCKKINPGDK